MRLCATLAPGIPPRIYKTAGVLVDPEPVPSLPKLTLQFALKHGRFRRKATRNWGSGQGLRLCREARTHARLCAPPKTLRNFCNTRNPIRQPWNAGAFPKLPQPYETIRHRIQPLDSPEPSGTVRTLTGTLPANTWRRSTSSFVRRLLPLF